MFQLSFPNSSREPVSPERVRAPIAVTTHVYLLGTDPCPFATNTPRCEVPTVCGRTLLFQVAWRPAYADSPVLG